MMDCTDQACKVSVSGATSTPRCNKNMTGHKMHEVVPQISQINPYNNGNMQIYRLARKISLVKKI